MNEFIAKRKIGQYKLFVDGVEFGSLENCEVCWIFVSDDEELSEVVSEALSGDISPLEMLPIIKTLYLGIQADRKSEAEHEMICEGAWLRAAECDPEAFDEMVREDMMGLS